MTLATDIEFFRAEHEALFSCEVLITRTTGAPTFDGDSETLTPAPDETIYEGPGEMRQRSGGADVQTGERETRQMDSHLWVPHDTPIEENDVVVVTASEHDADLAGVRFRITDVFLDGWQVVRNAECERIAPVFEEESS